MTRKIADTMMKRRLRVQHIMARLQTRH